MPSVRVEDLGLAAALSAARFAALLAAAVCGWTSFSPATAQEVRMPLQHSRLAGLRYYQAPAVLDRLAPGEPLDLRREPENAHDANAVRVEWRGHKLGYVPRRENATLAWAMDQGETIEARVVQARRHPRRRVEFEVFLR